MMTNIIDMIETVIDNLESISNCAIYSIDLRNEFYTLEHKKYIL